MNTQKSNNSFDELRSDIQGSINYYYFNTDDWTLKASIIKSLALYSRIPLEKITISVMHGYIILNGTVQLMHQKVVTKRMVENIKGLKGVINNIKVIN